VKGSITISLLTTSAIILGMVVPASGETAMISLPEVLGTYDFNATHSRTASFDFGTSFPGIQAAYIKLGGTGQTGTAYEFFHPEIHHNLYGFFESTMNPPAIAGYWWASTAPSDGPFDIEEPFAWRTGYSAEPSWDFLIDGQGEITINFGCVFPRSWVPETSPICSISEASLIVEPVPEPATVVLLGLGWVWVSRRRR